MRRVVLVLSIILLSFGALISSAEKTNKIIVKLKPQVSVEEVKATHPFVKYERASTLPRVFIFSVENINHVEKETKEFIADPKVAWAEIDEHHEYEPLVIPTDPSFQSGDQWFHGHINSSFAWAKGFSGQGQIVQVIDTPVFPDEIDLRNQLDFARSFEGNISAPPLRSITHGTVCANIIVAEVMFRGLFKFN
jgi:subtilisin family serine protease